MKNLNSGLWSVTSDGKHVHVHVAKRLPRKTKKWVSLIFEGAGDKATQFVVLSERMNNQLKLEK
jgi:hypothetical protein